MTTTYNDITVTVSTTGPLVNAPACFGCGVCMLVCPRGVFSVMNGKAVIADPDACTACGRCAASCPVGAIGVVSRTSAGQGAAGS